MMMTTTTTMMTLRLELGAVELGGSLPLQLS